MMPRYWLILTRLIVLWVHLDSVNLTTDGYPDEISWTLTDINENVIGNAPLNSLDEETSYEDIFCVNNNSYLTYEIYDGYGDGLLWEAADYSV